MSLVRMCFQKLAIDTPGPVWARQMTCSSPTTVERSERVPSNLKPRALNDGHEQPGSAHELKSI